MPMPIACTKPRGSCRHVRDRSAQLYTSSLTFFFLLFLPFFFFFFAPGSLMSSNSTSNYTHQHSSVSRHGARIAIGQPRYLQRRTSWNLVATAIIAVCEIRWDGELTLLADAHSTQAVIPAFDDLTLT